MKKDISIDMTRGGLAGKILLFTLPLMASGILQFFFNAADIVVVGRFAGYLSLAAVGSTSSLISMFTMLPFGLSIGVSMVIAKYIGHGSRQKEISLALHTAVTFGVLGGAALALTGIAFSSWMLRITGVPEDVFPLALIYLRIYSISFPALMLYNTGAAALRARGDTRWPLLFLVVSGVLNVILNLCFVIGLHMDVAGVAAATVISQYLSAMLVMWLLFVSDGPLKLDPRKLSIDMKTLRAVMRIGIPAAVQSCLFAISNIAIQSAINSYSSETIAAMSASVSIENFMYISMNAFNHACQTFNSQNLGAREYGRIRSATDICILFVAVLGVAEAIFVSLNAPKLIGIYNKNPEVIEIGAQRLVMISLTHFIYGISDVLVGALRGVGVPIAPVVINFLGAVVLRLIWVGLLDTSKYPVSWVNLSYPVSWVVIAAALWLYWIHYRRKMIDPMISAADL